MGPKEGSRRHACSSAKIKSGPRTVAVPTAALANNRGREDGDLKSDPARKRKGKGKGRVGWVMDRYESAERMG